MYPPSVKGSDTSLPAICSPTYIQLLTWDHVPVSGHKCLAQGKQGTSLGQSKNQAEFIPS